MRAFNEKFRSFSDEAQQTKMHFSFLLQMYARIYLLRSKNIQSFCAVNRKRRRNYNNNTTNGISLCILLFKNTFLSAILFFRLTFYLFVRSLCFVLLSCVAARRQSCQTQTVTNVLELVLLGDLLLSAFECMCAYFNFKKTPIMCLVFF